MKYLYIFTILAVVISFFADQNKTFKAFKVAYKKLKKILPQFISMLIFVSVVLFFLPESKISYYLSGSSILLTTIVAALLGSITMMPGFIAFPLCGILLSNGASYTTVAAFSSTLMMVGLVTYPIEKQYFGHKITVIRNIINFVIAIIVALFVGIILGELI